MYIHVYANSCISVAVCLNSVWPCWEHVFIGCCQCTSHDSERRTWQHLRELQSPEGSHMNYTRAPLVSRFPHKAIFNGVAGDLFLSRWEEKKKNASLDCFCRVLPIKNCNKVSDAYWVSCLFLLPTFPQPVWSLVVSVTCISSCLLRVVEFSSCIFSFRCLCFFLSACLSLYDLARQVCHLSCTLIKKRKREKRKMLRKKAVTWPQGFLLFMIYRLKITCPEPRCTWRTTADG